MRSEQTLPRHLLHEFYAITLPATHCYDYYFTTCLKDDRNCEYGAICL